ncbi:MAG: UDP-N-acetylmuramoyl-L-alanyl-D-glutamate-2,6-diaminopimelate ligase [Candidatus Moranbacteria bacterium GW2011_GWC2_37_73]|nr:MAG: UDP-N-acetylmuramoylalanyl-D-glutamate-2,6-diaminopimelate ligase, UDP-N-acetylmuramoylalanyl-D-glutamate-2,6-diaminopimelate ligase [Parcubacteria group bacterium GW2011_GWC1_36_108]KKQ00584.1 MAG: UDP-N-acetylmuramoyl-L-alanyl-D-glutamate-2,6-diaminopimelate ligase [Candidatus Moranbacteria bacterium GW2011_GWD1_36_198]KKQ02033.1 MAG: UDP-N-acetylmuramoyl-L-alanyl-D-glutamate-2,6-diaminopimelate ligase [Candidatus Moranbacteria bacterium GW2011_GWD2_36_198]KKQ39890.1 MAG: UDP-N-acetylm
MHYIKKLFPQNIKNLYHLAQAVVANVWYGFPSRKLKVIGVTGTDGKTTTVQMVTKILEEAGRKVAMASTINFKINGVEEKNLSHFTTESALTLQKFIKKAVDAGCEYLVLETSSHSLDQYRVWGVDYKTAVITNVTREHLDYHKTMEKYREAKKKLFENVEKNKGTNIVNLDMENPNEFVNFNVEKKYGYTTKIESTNLINQNDNVKIKIVNAENIEIGINGSSFEIGNFSAAKLAGMDEKKSIRLNLQLPGLFNVENALAATCVGLSEEIGIETIKDALAKIKGVAGRMEAVENDLGLHILVDFALTPNALERLYSTLFQAKKSDSKIIAIFGSCGDRDRGKRPIMGGVVSKYADVVILTNDEPYYEKPEQIIEEIAVGIKNKTEGQNFWKIIDRREAIRKAIEIAQEGDIICITGMGDFETMVVGDKKIPWNDRKVIEEELVR